jgi:hypothetical protein
MLPVRLSLYPDACQSASLIRLALRLKLGRIRLFFATRLKASKATSRFVALRGLESSWRNSLAGTNSRLFIPKRVDRIECGGFPSGIVPKRDSDEH